MLPFGPIFLGFVAGLAVAYGVKKLVDYVQSKFVTETKHCSKSSQENIEKSKQQEIVKIPTPVVATPTPKDNFALGTVLRYRPQYNKSICLVTDCNKDSVYVAMDCGHHCLCETCAVVYLAQLSPRCPYCNIEVTEFAVSRQPALTEKQEGMKRQMNQGSCLNCFYGEIEFSCLPCGHRTICRYCLNLYNKKSIKKCLFCDEKADAFEKVPTVKLFKVD